LETHHPSSSSRHFPNPRAAFGNKSSTPSHSCQRVKNDQELEGNYLGIELPGNITKTTLETTQLCLTQGLLIPAKA